MPNEFEKIKVADDGQEATGDEEKKRQKRGGKGMMKAKKKDDGPKQVAEMEQHYWIFYLSHFQISVSRAPRGKKKFVTIVTGVASFGIHPFVTLNP